MVHPLGQQRPELRQMPLDLLAVPLMQQHTFLGGKMPRVDRLCRINMKQIIHQTFSNAPLTVLVDYFGQEITDALNVAGYLGLSDAGQLSLRIDTHGGRFVEG